MGNFISSGAAVDRDLAELSYLQNLTKCLPRSTGGALLKKPAHSVKVRRLGL